MITTQGLTHIENIVFRGGTQITAWYVGLIDNSGYTALDISDTLGAHTGWSEVATGTYSQSTRVQWTPASPTGTTTVSCVNSSTCDHSILLTKSIVGLFICSNNTKGGGSGSDILMATALFDQGVQAVKNTDVLKITFTYNSSTS